MTKPQDHAESLSGMSVDESNAEAKKWLCRRKHPRFKQLYKDLICSHCNGSLESGLRVIF